MTAFQDHKRALEQQGFYIPQPANGLRFEDADGQIFFARQLEHVEAKSYDVVYQDLMWRMLFPIDTNVPPGAKSITYETFDKAGRMRWGNPGAKDLPRVDIAGKETTLPVHWGFDSFAYNVGEIESARMAGMPLEQRKANAARRVIEEGLNDIAFLGDATLGFVGLLSAGNGIPRVTAPNGGGGTPQWPTKTPDEIVADVNAAFSKVDEDTNQKEKPQTVLLPTARYNYLRNTRMSSTSDISIMKYLINEVGWIESIDRIQKVPDLTGAGTGGVEIMVIYDRNSEKIEFKLPMDTKFWPVQQQGLEWMVPVTAVAGGLHIRYPLSALIYEDI
jgi:hypothetical protein